MRSSSSIATSRSVRPARPASSSPEGLVGELAGGADACDLARVLDGAQPRDHAVAGDRSPSVGEQLLQARGAA